jgi:hypothetical protein
VQNPQGLHAFCRAKRRARLLACQPCVSCSGPLATSKKMKLRIFNILTLTLLIFVSACSNSRLSDEEIENKAIAITEKLNKENIDIFRKWNFGN